MFSNVGSFRRDRRRRTGRALDNGKDSRGSAREQIKRDLQRAHDLVLLTLDALVRSMKYDGV